MTRRLAGAADIGGTKMLVGIVDDGGTVLCQRCFHTQTGEGGVESSLEELVSELCAQCGTMDAALTDLAGIGIVCAGPVDPQLGIIENPYTLPGWQGYPVARRLSEKTGLPVRLENDANGMLLGEVRLRGIRADERALMITFGTGIGVAAYMQGALYRGGGRFHPEMGHVIVDQDGPDCYCGHRGCFESLCSGASLNRLSVEAGYKEFDDVVHRAGEGDPRAAAFMEATRRRICSGVWNLMTIFKPQRLILGGGLMDGYFEMMRDVIRADLEGLQDFVEPFEICKATRHGASALVGAASLMLD